MSQLFISHSAQDDAFVRELRAALADHGQPGWIDSRELRGGDPLWMEIQKPPEKRRPAPTRHTSTQDLPCVDARRCCAPWLRFQSPTS